MPHTSVAGRLTLLAEGLMCRMQCDAAQVCAQARVNEVIGGVAEREREREWKNNKLHMHLYVCLVF